MPRLRGLVGWAGRVRAARRRWGNYAAGVEVADLTGDGRRDVAVSASGVQVFPQREDGTLGLPIVYPSDGVDGAIVAVDADGDTLSDIVKAGGPTTTT